MFALFWVFGFPATANGVVPIVEFTKVKQGEVFPWPLVVVEGKTTKGVMESLQSIHEDFKCLFIKHDEVVNKYPVYKGHFKAVVKLRKGKNRLRFMTSPNAKDGLDLELNYKPETNKKKVRIVYCWVEEDKGNFLIPETPNRPAGVGDLESAKKRMAIMMMLLQSNYGMLMDQRGYGKRTVNLEYDKAGDVIVHAPMIPGTWASMGSQKLGMRNARNSTFPGVEFKESRTEHPDITTIMFGHSADMKGNKGPGTSAGGAWLIGARLPHFPETIEELNWKLVDPKDRYPAGVSQASNRLGGAVHELGHTLGFQHTMARDIMNGNGGQCYKNFMLLDWNKSYRDLEEGGVSGPMLVSDDRTPLISHQTAQHFMLSPWCSDGPRYPNLILTKRNSKDFKPVVYSEDKDNFIIEWETGIRMVEFFEFRHLSPAFKFYPEVVKVPSNSDKLPTKVVISKKEVLKQMISGRKNDVNRKWITTEFDDVDISVDHIRNLYVTDGLNRRYFTPPRDPKYLSPRMTAILISRFVIKDAVEADFSSEVTRELAKLGYGVHKGLYTHKRIKDKARLIYITERKKGQAALKKGASKKEKQALLAYAKEQETIYMDKWAAKIKAEAATRKGKATPGK